MDNLCGFLQLLHLLHTQTHTPQRTHVHTQTQQEEAQQPQYVLLITGTTNSNNNKHDSYEFFYASNDNMQTVQPIDYILNVILSNGDALFYIKDILNISSIEDLLQFWPEHARDDTLTNDDFDKIKAFQIWYIINCHHNDDSSVFGFSLREMTKIVNFPTGENTVSGKDVTLDEYWKETMGRASTLGIINSNNRIKTGGLSNNSSKISQSDGKTNVSVQDYGTKETKLKGHLAGKRGHLWCEPDNDDPNIKAGWYEIIIGNYTSAETRNKERGMYFLR